MIERATRLGPGRFLPATSDDPISVSPAQQKALLARVHVTQRGEAMSAYVNQSTIAALQRSGALKADSHFLSPAGREIRATLLREERARA